MVPDIEHGRLLEVLNYDPATGIFTWNVGLGLRKQKRDIAGTRMLPSGYLKIMIAGKRYLAHRLAWFYVHKEWPPEMIDHVNGITNDNRIENLRLANRSENRMNAKVNIDSISGHKGIRWNARSKSGR